jgi:GNAT superfamily N-acetyltransferase
MDSTFRIRRLAPPEARAAAPALAEVLADCVAGGASVSFMADLTFEDALAFWRGEAAADDGRAILVAEDDQGLFGVVQLVPCWPPNQPHRADVSKLLVHRRGRGRGAAKALMLALEAEARAMGKRLLVLDTIAGGAAERLYAGLGWTRGGEIPDFALMPDGTPAGTIIFYKQLAP